jgi:CheY-like chemotaxis protein
VYGIVEQNGGRIEVHSEPGEGARFTVSFPRVEGVATNVRPLARERPLGHGETVLVVEDDVTVRRMAVRALKRLGYVSLVANSGEDALAIAQRHEGHIALLLTDVVMPHMNGRELAKAIMESRSGIKVLYTSGYARDVLGQHGVIDEGLEFLRKPYTFDDLAVRLREVLDEHAVKSSRGAE